jgi:surfactin synthase thioesterase subunit
MTDRELWDICREIRESGRYYTGDIIRASVTDVALIRDNVIAVDGSDTWQEWLGNILAFRTIRCGAHQSFERAARCIWEQINDRLDRGAQYVLTGPSRGGAIAVILAGIMSAHGYAVIVVTFGAPKSGSTHFWRDYDPVHIAHEIEGDPVPALPFWWRANPSAIVIRYPRVGRGARVNHLGYGEALP